MSWCAVNAWPHLIDVRADDGSLAHQNSDATRSRFPSCPRLPPSHRARDCLRGCLPQVFEKKRGRPRSGQIPVFSLFRLQIEWQQSIDEWRSQEPGHPSRSEAVRMLLAIALCAADEERKREERRTEEPGVGSRRNV